MVLLYFFCLNKFCLVDHHGSLVSCLGGFLNFFLFGCQIFWSSPRCGGDASKSF